MPAAPEFQLDAERLVESLPHVVWILTPEGETVFVNRAGMELLGMERLPDGTLPSHWGYVHPDDLEMGAAAWERAATTETGFGAEVRVRHADGTYRWMLIRGEPVIAPDGALLFWAGTATDIHDIKLTEAALAEAERGRAESAAILEAMVTRAPIGLAFVDRDYRFVHVNDTLAAINGLAVAEHHGRTVAEVVPTLWPQLEPLYARVLDGDHVHDVEIEGESPALAGDQRSWRVSYYPVSLAGEIIGVGVVARDVTVEREAERERARAAAQRRRLLAETLRAQDDERRRITAELHDEYIPRVAATRMELEALRPAISDPAQQTTIDRLEDDLQWMLSALRELIFDLRPPSLDRGLEAAMADHLAQVGAASGAHTRFAFELGVEPPLDTTELLFRITREALSNVQRHSGAATITLDAAEDAGGVRVRVADDGVGFDVAAAEARPGHLGLELMRERAELGGGRIEIDSRPGAGTRVDLWMPLDARL